MYSCDVIYRFLPLHVCKHVLIRVLVCIYLAATESVPKLPLSENAVTPLKSHCVQWIGLVTNTIKCSKGLFNKCLPSSGALNSTVWYEWILEQHPKKTGTLLFFSMTFFLWFRSHLARSQVGDPFLCYELLSFMVPRQLNYHLFFRITLDQCLAPERFSSSTASNRTQISTLLYLFLYKYNILYNISHINTIRYSL